MEILINESSLSGQFSSIEHFVETGLRPFVKALNDVDLSSNSLYKRYDFYQTKITSYHTIHDVLTGFVSRQYDEIRKFKSQLVKLFNNPYWEDNPKQSADSIYTYNGNNISGSSLAEAYERDSMVISFHHNDFLLTQIPVYKDENKIELDNLFNQGHFTQIAYLQHLIPFDVFCCKMFSNSKLNFSEIDSKEGFSLVKREKESLFLDSFRKFSELSWQQIFVDDALDYKEYNNKHYFKHISEKIYKFRISQKYRCFGYVKDNVFFVLQFDLEHKLSD